MNIGTPNKNSKVCIGGNWVAATANGYILYLFNNSNFKKFFRFEKRIEKIVFSPSGNTIYIIDSSSMVWKRSLTQRSLTNDKDNFIFSQLIKLPFLLSQFSFITIIPFEKAIYIIADNKVFITYDGKINNEFELETSISATYILPTEIAKSFKLADSDSITLFTVVCGTANGTVSTLKLPNELIKHEELSLTFIMKSEPVTLFAFTPKNYCAVGKYGTIESVSLTGKVGTGSLPFPIAAASINDTSISFVSNSHLYSCPILTPSAFHIIPSFPSRIMAACDGYAITNNGMLVPLSSRVMTVTIPRPELIEFDLEELKKISEEDEKLKRNILASEAKLCDIQLIKSLQNGRTSFESALTIQPSMSPDGRTVVDLLITLTPIGSFSCQGLTILIVLTDSFNKSDSYCLPNVQTINVTWKKRIFVVSSSLLRCDIIVSHGSDSAVAASDLFDILDFSVPIEPSLANVGTNPLSITKQVKTCSFSLGGSLPEPLAKPQAMQSPTGEIWTMRCDNGVCTVTASTIATVMAIRAAVERRVIAEGTFAFNPVDEAVNNLRSMADDIISSAIEIVPVKGGIKSRVSELHSETTKYADAKLSETT